MQEAKKGDAVSVHYTGTLTDGTQFDSSVGREPLSFTVGAGQMIPGFDKAVDGMKVGEKQQITIPADEAYGQRRDDMVIPMPKSNIPAEMDPKVGDQLALNGQDGQPIPVKVVEITEEHIMLDANHDLAGKDLVFDIELVSIG